MSGDSIPFAPPDITDAEIEAVTQVLKSGWLTTGKQAQAFERAVAERCSASSALATNSGTAALHLALVINGIGPGDEVIVPALTFCSTAHVIVHCGATPVLVDVDPETLNIDPAAIEAAVTQRTRAVVVVHYAGHPVDLDAIKQLADDHDLVIVEDAAHAIGAAWRETPIGGTGNPTAFSFYATKNLVTAEGGMLLADQQTIDKARVLALHGMDRNSWNRYDVGGSYRYEVDEPGFKYNCTDIQAALGLAQLKRFDHMQSRRREVVQRYHQHLSDCEALILPTERVEVTHAWHLYVVRLRLERVTVSRDDVLAALTQAGIGTSVHFIPLHHHRWMRDRYPLAEGALPVTDRAFAAMLSLPLNSVISDEQVDRVCETLKVVVERARR